MNTWTKELKKLVGGKIVDVAEDAEESWNPEQTILGLVVEMPNKSLKVMWLLSDEEGNGAGRFEIVNQ
jgi:hypothetical protein